MVAGKGAVFVANTGGGSVTELPTGPSAPARSRLAVQFPSYLRHHKYTARRGPCRKGLGRADNARMAAGWPRRQRTERDEGKMIERYVLGIDEIDTTQVALVGGKGAQLGELWRVEGIRVPAGFCVTTDAFRLIMTNMPSIDDQLERLSSLSPDDREAIRTLSAEIRRAFESIAVPDDLAAAITASLARLGEQAAYAVRSSATAEDLPTASFAGQQDTYLNVIGPASVLSTSAGAGPRCSPSGP